MILKCRAETGLKLLKKFLSFLDNRKQPACLNLLPAQGMRKMTSWKSNKKNYKLMINRISLHCSFKKYSPSPYKSSIFNKFYQIFSSQYRISSNEKDLYKYIYKYVNSIH